MRKFIFFALAALTLAFTACEGNGPSNPKNINPKDYAGTTWFLDSVDVGGYTTSHMCQPIFLLSENDIQIGNEICKYIYENSKLTIIHESTGSSTPQVYELISLDSKGAVLKAGQAPDVRIYYISAIPTLDRNKQNPISEAALLGKYKMIIGSMTETKASGSSEISYNIGGMITWITFKENNKMLFEDSSPNADMEGIWELNIAEKKICYGTYSSLADMHEYGHPEDILVFNDDYLVTGSDYDYQDGSHRHYESVFVRVK